MTNLLLVVVLASQTGAAASGFQSFSAALESGQSHWHAGNVGKARADFTAAQELATKPLEKAQARLWFGHCEYQAGRYEAARSAYKAVLEIPGATRDELYYAYQYLGHTYVQEENFPAALGYYRDAVVKVGPRPSLRHNGDNDIAFAYRDQNNLAYRLYRMGRYSQAREAYQAALDMPGIPDRERADACLHMGHCWRGEKQYDRARGEYEKVLALKTLHPDPWHQSEAMLFTGRSFQDQGRREEAVVSLRGVLTLDGAHPGHRQQARDLLKKLGEKVPADVRGPLDAQYGAECNPTGDRIGGGADYRRAIRSGDYTVSTFEELTQSLLELGKRTPAERKGKVVFVRPGATIQVLDRWGIHIPSGVTLAGNRGNPGEPSRICVDRHVDADWLLMLEPDSRLSGLSIRGDTVPFKELFGMWPGSYFPKDFFESRKLQKPRVTAVVCDDRTEVDNCEIECFQSGIACQGLSVHVHHNRLHDIHAYPVMISRSAAMPLIEANAIAWAWHGIAAVDDMRASYEARYNVFREEAPNLWGQAISGQFAVDAHGQGDRYLVHHNTFFHADRSKGIPNRSVCLAPAWEAAQVYNNWFRDWMTKDQAAMWIDGKPYPSVTELRQIVTRRDLSRFMALYLGRKEYDIQRFDLRQLVAMTRAGGGGENLWVYDNAYGPDKEQISPTLFTTPKLLWNHPVHRKIRTDLGRGRGGDTHPPLRHLYGRVPLDVEVELFPGLTLKQVSIDLILPDRKRLMASPYYLPATDETRRLYHGPQTPQPGKIVLDTRPLANGIYGLVVTAEDDRGIQAENRTFFEVLNPAGTSGRRTKP